MKRSLLKAISWRIVGTIDTLFISFIITQNVTIALKISFAEVISKIFLYVLHERLWLFSKWATHQESKTEFRKRSLAKAVSWRLLGTLDTSIISYLFTDKLKWAASIGGIEVLSKFILFYLHERLWNKIK
ncbi:MAG: DUF2061 domain-containing protein [Thermonemataceae bacterium]|nr:DUF2061 domain-containing protein [Thermonemataceae bacterium]